MNRIVGLILVTFASFGFSQTTNDFFKNADIFFDTYVSQGKVDYQKIQRDPTSLKEVLDIASKVTIDKGDADTYQAFFINGYNLSVIKGIVDHYPTKSPLDIKGFFDKNTFNLAGKKTTLNDLENKILRKQFPDEPRFHFVLVCAGLGCPPIISEAYRPETLDSQLQRQTIKSLNNSDFIKVKDKKVQLSQIFEWYKEDFTKTGSVIDFVNKYRDMPIPAKSKISYYPYNWSLNEIK